MRKLLLVLALLLLPSLAWAQCNGNYPASTACGTVAGGTPGPVAFSAITGNGITALTGDGTATGPGSVPLTLATVNASPGTFGSTTRCVAITVNGKGLATTVTDALCAPALSQLPQGVANSIWINPTNSTAGMQNLAVPACANDGLHGLVYVNGTGLVCSTLTVGGVTSVTCFGVAITTTGTCATAATKSDEQTGSSTTAVVTPSQQQQHDSAAKAWLSMASCSTTCTNNAAYNITGVPVRNSTGNYTVTFTTAFATANYVCSHGTATASAIRWGTKTTSTIVVLTFNTSFAALDSDFDLVCFGRQ